MIDDRLIGPFSSPEEIEERIAEYERTLERPDLDARSRAYFEHCLAPLREWLPEAREMYAAKRGTA